MDGGRWGVPLSRSLPLYNLRLYAAYIEIKFFYYSSLILVGLFSFLLLLHFSLNYANFSFGTGGRF